MAIGLLASPPPPMLEALERRPTSAITERQLVDGYGAMVVDRRDCLCGRQIVVTGQFGDASIAEAVGAHNALPSHEAWAFAAGWR